MPSGNTKRKSAWTPVDEVKGLKLPTLKFFKDVALTEPHDFNFNLVDRGTVGELPFYLKNFGPQTVYDMSFTIVPEPDEDYATNSKSAAPMQVEVTPEPPKELKAGYMFQGKFVWRPREDDPIRKCRASVLVSGRFTDE